MNLTSNWTLISSAGALVQKQGTRDVSIAYATQLPTTEDDFTINHNNTVAYPAVTGKSLYAKASSGSAVLSVEEL